MKGLQVFRQTPLVARLALLAVAAGACTEGRERPHAPAEVLEGGAPAPPAGNGAGGSGGAGGRGDASGGARDAARDGRFDGIEAGKPDGGGPDASAPDGGRDGGDGHAPDALLSPDAAPPPDASVPPPGTGFVDVAFEAGLRHAQATVVDCGPCDFEPPHFTGGAAAGDFDGDGLVDLYFTRFDGPDLLYRNRGDGTFEDVAAAWGLDRVLPSNGAGFADVDNDGDLDLYVTSVGTTRFHLFINDGAGRFTEEAAARGAAIENAGVHQGFSVSFGDYDRDGWVDLHTCEWRYKIGSSPPNSRLLRNLGEASPGHFEDRTDAAGVSLLVTADDSPFLTADDSPFEPEDEHVFSFSSSFADLDGDGWPDLVVAADFGTSRLFWNNENGTFTDGTSAAGVGTDENGMGSALGDFDGDGLIDWFVTSIHDPDSLDAGFWGYGRTGNRLYRNNGDRTFSDHTDQAGVRAGFWGWGAVFFDYDNDGDLDLVMTSGVAFPEVPVRSSPLRLWRNDGGSFVEVSRELGLVDIDDGKGLLVLDYDDDGDLDLVVVNHAAPPRLYRNDVGNANGWLRLRLVGTHSTRDAWGARVEVIRSPGAAPMVRELVGGNHYLGQSEAVLHFGLGPDPGPVAEVRIRWPRSGQEQVLLDVEPNQTLEIVEPSP